MSDDPRLAAVRRARVGRPAMVFAPDGKPAFWIVPFEQGGLACGFARVELNLGVSQLGTFGSGSADKASWPKATFFARPPKSVIAEIEAKHPALRNRQARLSYDGSPSRWGWRIEGRGEAEPIVFILPGGWYVRRVEPRDDEREG